MKHLLKVLLVMSHIFISYPLLSYLEISGIKDDSHDYVTDLWHDSKDDHEDKIYFSAQLIQYSGHLSDLYDPQAESIYNEREISHTHVHALYYLLLEIDRFYQGQSFDRNDVFFRENSFAYFRLREFLQTHIKAIGYKNFLSMYKAAHYFRIPELVNGCAYVIAHNIKKFYRLIQKNLELSGELKMRIAWHFLIQNITHPKNTNLFLHEEIQKNNTSIQDLLKFIPGVHSPNSSYETITHDNGFVQIWDKNARECILNIRIAQTLPIAFSPDGKHCAYARNNRITLIHLKTEEHVDCGVNGLDEIKEVVFSPNGTQLIAIDSNDIVCTWQLAHDTWQQLAMQMSFKDAINIYKG